MILVTNTADTISITGDLSMPNAVGAFPMTTQINSLTTQDQTVVANVTYTLTDNGYTETDDVPIFQPQTLIDILNGVYSRGLTVISQHG